MRIVGITIVFALLVSSCVVHQGTAGASGKVPPGQAKKMHGSKSAKPYAPGQVKKRYR